LARSGATPISTNATLKHGDCSGRRRREAVEQRSLVLMTSRYRRCAKLPSAASARTTSNVDRFGDANKIVLAMNGLLGDLVSVPDTASRFEQAMNQLAFFLSFKGQRPENEFGKGPDNLWEVGSLQYFVIEDKNGATTDLISKDSLSAF
jgi:hypothetical protein